MEDKEEEEMEDTEEEEEEKKRGRQGCAAKWKLLYSHTICRPTKTNRWKTGRDVT